jgi:putative transposase
MAKRRYTAEEIVTVLRQVEVVVGSGKPTPQACREAGITEQTYYRWRKECGGLKLEQAKRLKELEKRKRVETVLLAASNGAFEVCSTRIMDTTQRPRMSFLN